MAQFLQSELVDQGLGQIQTRFKDEANKYLVKPVKVRELTNPCCFAFFIVLFLTFVIYSAISINQLAIQTDFDFDKLDDSFLKNVEFQDMKNFAIIVLSMFAMSIVLGVLLCACMFQCADKVLFYMAVSGVLPVFALAIYLVAQGSVIADFSIYFFMLGFFYATFICYLRDHLQKAAILSKTIAVFILENKRILFLVFITLVYCLILVILWVFGLYSFIVRYSSNDINYSGFVWLSIFWGFLLAFFTFSFYYTSVFVTSYSLAIWFYQRQDMDSIGTPFKHLAFYHIGTVTKIAMQIALLRVIKFMILLAHCQRTEGICHLLGLCCSCIVCFCLGIFQALIQVRNTYAIVTCALLGQDLQKSTQIAAHIAFEDYEAFNLFAYCGYVLQIGAAICVGSIPAIVGTSLLNANIDNSYMVIVGSLICFFICATIGQVILQVFLQSIHTLYMMYRLDTELIELGHEVTWVQEFGNQLNAGFDEAFIGQIKKKPKPKYKNVTTVVVHQNGFTEVYQNKVQVQQVQNPNQPGFNEQNTVGQL